MPFNVEGARKAGYSDAEIAQHLAAESRFDLAGARKAGYSDGEVIAELAGKLSKRAEIPITGDPERDAQIRQDEMALAQQLRDAEANRTIVDKAIGTGEAALTTLTGATGGTAGMAGGLLQGIARSILDGTFGTPDAARMVEQAAMRGAQGLTYEPRTPSGQEQAEAVGRAAANLLPIAGIAPGARPPAGAASRAPLPVTARAAVESAGRAVGGEPGAAGAARAVDAVTRVANMAKSGATTLPRRALEALRREPEAVPTPGTMGSVGAAGTDMAAIRRANAEALGFAGDRALTKGQASRDPAQLKFEVETAKLPEEGARLRQRVVAQNDQILKTFDNWIDQTGSQAPTLRAVGVAVDKALVEQAAKDKAQLRAMYKAAEQAGEMEAPVALTNLVAHLNESAPEAATAPLLTTARAKALQLGLAREEGGQLVVNPVPLKTAESFRQSINRATNHEATNVRQATIMKGLVDEATQGLGGDLYRRARGLRSRYAQNYEDRAVVAKLLSEKRGTSDRAVALEDVFKHTVLDGSLDDVRNVRRVLHRAGGQGNQAWRELQGSTVRWMRDEATKGVAPDSSGNRVVSPSAIDKAIRQLDQDGKLEFVFGKKGAQQLRDLNELAQYVKTVPPEAAANTSNTAATLLAAVFDTTLSGLTGTPAPVTLVTREAVKQIKNAKLRRRIEDALNDHQRKDAPGKPRAPLQAPGSNRTVH